MFLFKRGGHAIANTGQTFRAFLKSGFQGHVATMEDWKTHLNTLFPEVRLKKTIEVRGADVQATDLACALPALWTGILYDDRALAEAEALVEGWTHDEVAALRTSVWRDGLRASFRGRPLAEVAERMVAIADGGLERRGVMDPTGGKDERVHLVRLRKLVGEGRCPADALLDGIEREADLERAIVERSALK
jgi:glutamate--cysteine ligase